MGLVARLVVIRIDGVRDGGLGEIGGEMHSESNIPSSCHSCFEWHVLALWDWCRCEGRVILARTLHRRTTCQCCPTCVRSRRMCSHHGLPSGGLAGQTCQCLRQRCLFLLMGGCQCGFVQLGCLSFTKWRCGSSEMRSLGLKLGQKCM